MPAAEGLEGETMGLARRESLDNFFDSSFLPNGHLHGLPFIRSIYFGHQNDVPTVNFNFCSGKVLEREELDLAW